MRDIKFLSYAFGRRNGKCQFYIHVDSIKKMKIKIRELTSRNNGWSSEYRKQRLTWYIRGWLNYFKFAGLKSRIKEWDGLPVIAYGCVFGSLGNESEPGIEI